MDINQVVQKIVADCVYLTGTSTFSVHQSIILENVDEEVRELGIDAELWGTTIEYVDEDLFQEYLLNNFGHAYKYVGRGSFSVAILETATNRVIKISLGDKDTAPLFWQFCIANKAKYLPKIYRLGEFTDPTTGLKIRWALTPKYRTQRDYSEVLYTYHRSHMKGRDHTYKVLSKQYFPLVNRWALVNGLTLDLHDENVMQDKQGNWVCIDPVSIPK